ncbi:MAG TPA: hypothetical protein VL689_05195 [Paraburkholderia sp.]|jgi:hypothetical protein|nr:hypothetical protein [Paraburkholderia sp.]
MIPFTHEEPLEKLPLPIQIYNELEPTVFSISLWASFRKSGYRAANKAMRAAKDIGRRSATFSDRACFPRPRVRR